MLFAGSESLAELNYLHKGNASLLNSVFARNNALASEGSLFFSQGDNALRETPDLKLAGESFVYGITTPRAISAQTMGDIVGDETIIQTGRTEPVEYIVQAGDTPSSVAAKFGLSLNSVLWANSSLSKNSVLKVGDELTIPPADGILYEVKSGDTLSAVAAKYKADIDQVIEDNGLANAQNIFVDDVIFLRNAQQPLKYVAPVIVEIPTADSFYGIPTQGRISQLGHGYLRRGMDVANDCGTPVHAAAGGVVERSQFNSVYGNFVTIRHATGSTYSGHLSKRNVVPGQVVSAGEVIGLMGKTGTAATGCHLHFEVRGGAKNPLAKYGLGATVSFK